MISGPVEPNPPGAPLNPNATNLTSNSVTINWTDTDNRETGFAIERKGAGSQAVWSRVGTVAANVTSFSDSGLSPSTSYYYRVAAFNADGSSSFTNELFVSTPVAAPQAPATLSKSGSTTTSLTLAWSGVAGATGYKIERLVGPLTWNTILTVGSGVRSSTVSGLASGRATPSGSGLTTVEAIRFPLPSSRQRRISRPFPLRPRSPPVMGFRRTRSWFLDARLGSGILRDFQELRGERGWCRFPGNGDCWSFRGPLSRRRVIYFYPSGRRRTAGQAPWVSGTAGSTILRGPEHRRFSSLPRDPISTGWS